MSPGRSGVIGDNNEAAMCKEPGHRPIVLEVVNSVTGPILRRKQALRRTWSGQNWKVRFRGTILRL